MKNSGNKEDIKPSVQPRIIERPKPERVDEGKTTGRPTPVRK
jgi:hypothetical protein